MNWDNYTDAQIRSWAWQELIRPKWIDPIKLHRECERRKIPWYCGQKFNAEIAGRDSERSADSLVGTKETE